MQPTDIQREEMAKEFEKGGCFLAIIIVFLIVFIVLCFSSCSVQKKYQSMAFKCYDVYPSIGCYVHKFESLSGKYVRDELLDSVICQVGDTIIIKDVAKCLTHKIYFKK